MHMRSNLEPIFKIHKTFIAFRSNYNTRAVSYSEPSPSLGLLTAYICSEEEPEDE